MKYKIYYSQKVFFEDEIEISNDDLTEFFRYLVEEQYFQWPVIDTFRRRNEVHILIEAYLEYFKEWLVFNPITSSDLEGIKATEIED